MTDTASASIAPELTQLYQHYGTFEQALHALNTHLGPLIGLTVLEAGCGSASHLALQQCIVTGIDISPYQLERNQHLSERICADLHQYDNPQWLGAFDLIVCWDVVEHLQNPKAVIAKFFKWVKPTGKVVLAYPNPQIWKGVVTKYSPYFVHQWFYRLASGTPLSASKTDQGPFRTVFATDIKLKPLLHLAAQYQHKVEFFISYESYQNQFVKRFLPHRFVDAMNWLFLGELRTVLDISATDFIIVLSPCSIG
ncbi:MAG: class I SAM-dependent methyltransferase [Chloroherpetonaceae bacterium]|nr:class I SAM-dependent methyltransferase [Chloroherpetonaceae bacterium]